MRYGRAIEIERGKIDRETGEFPLVLFTDGEASDGHILRIAGATTPARMPLFVNHFADPSEQLGSLESPERREHEIAYTGRIDVAGDSGYAEVRRDIVHMIAEGHVGRMSGRWDASEEDVTRRTALPSDHPAHVASDAKGAARWGLFFERWTALEGSVVGLGADPGALIGRSKDTGLPEHVRAFWGAMAEDAERDAAGMADPCAALARIASDVAIARGLGIEDADLLNALGIDEGVSFTPVELDGASIFLPADAARQVTVALAALVPDDEMPEEEDERAPSDLPTPLRSEGETPEDATEAPDEVPDNEPPPTRTVDDLSAREFMDGLSTSIAEATGNALSRLLGRRNRR